MCPVALPALQISQLNYSFLGVGVGVCRINRAPKPIRTGKKSSHEWGTLLVSKVAASEDAPPNEKVFPLLSLMFYDSKPVHMLTTIHTAELVDNLRKQGHKRQRELQLREDLERGRNPTPVAAPHIPLQVVTVPDFDVRMQEVTELLEGMGAIPNETDYGGMYSRYCACCCSMSCCCLLLITNKQ